MFGKGFAVIYECRLRLFERNKPILGYPPSLSVLRWLSIHPVNKPIYWDAHLRADFELVCMFSICLFFACRCWNCSPVSLFLPTLSCFFSRFFHELEFAFRYFSKFYPPLFSFGYCAMHPVSSLVLLKRGLAGDRGTPSGSSERKTKAISSFVRFALFLLWKSRAHWTDSECRRWAGKLLQRIPLWCYCEQLQC